MNKEREWVESSIHDFKRVVWTNCDVLWTDKLSSDVSNDDE